MSRRKGKPCVEGSDNFVRKKNVRINFFIYKIADEKRLINFCNTDFFNFLVTQNDLCNVFFPGFIFCISQEIEMEEKYFM